MIKTQKTLNIFANATLLIALTIANLSAGASARAASPALGLQAQGITSSTSELSYVPDVVLIGLRPGISLEMGANGPTNLEQPLATNSPALAASLEAIRVQSLKPVFPETQIVALASETGLSQIYRLRLPASSDVKAAIQSLAGNHDILFSEPDYIAQPADIPIAAATATVKLTLLHVSHAIDPLYNDPLYDQQWGLAKINIESAWLQTTGALTTIIAIIDSGIDLTHPDLAANLWINPGEIAGNGIDDDNNGLIDDVNGWNFVFGNNDVWDDNGHGSLVAGVAAAVGNNGQGIVGVCPQCRIMPVKVMQASGAANYSDIAAGVLYAAQKGAKVINLSLGGYANSNTLRNAIDTAVNTYGAVVVAGSGNDNLSTSFYPAAYDNVLAVAGTANDDTKLNFSNYGTWVDVSAPAVNIRTTALGGDWANGSGTSVAAPFAAGLAGLLRTLHPDWNQATIRSQIAHTTDSIESLNPTYAGMLGSGRLNAGIAVQSPHPILSMSGYTVNELANGRPALGTTANLTVTLSNDWWNALGVTGTLSTTDPYVSMINASASYGDIPAATTKTNPTAFAFTVNSAAGYNHPIPFTLTVTDTTGYSNSFNFTVNTETGVVNKSGTLTTDTWTNDKTYLITNNISIPTGNTLTIQPGTVVKFNGNYALSVRGTLIADGTASQPIQFKSNTVGAWDKIFFDDLNIDAVADGDGNYLSGSILRYVNIEGDTNGITCTTATPYLSHINIQTGGITCALGATPVWFLDNTIVGDVSFTGPGNAYRNTVSGGLSISGTGIAEDNILGSCLFLGTGIAKRNTVTGGWLTVDGSTGNISNNSVSGNVNAGESFQVLNNTITGSLITGNSATVDHNTVSNGITVGSSAVVTWNTVENVRGNGLTSSSNVTVRYNRLIGNVTGMTATTGLIEHNLIANNGVGLQVGAAIVRYNTFTGNSGNTIQVQGGNPLAIEYNNLEGNIGTYDLYIDIASGVSVSAQNNWWGTTDNLAIGERIYDWNDDDTRASATYTLKENAPDQNAPGYVRSIEILPDSTLGIQTGTFAMQFSRAMDDNFNPRVEFFNSNEFVQLSTGRLHTCVLKRDASVLCWGNNGYGRTDVPLGSYTRVDAGDTNTCGVKSDGSLLCWGYNNSGMSNPPSGSYIQASEGSYHSCGLRNDGTIICWGYLGYGEVSPMVLPGNFTQISGWYGSHCGLKFDGSVLCWNLPSYLELEGPSGNNYIQVSAGLGHNCAVSSDGSLLCWGNNDYGQTLVPPGSYTQGSAGGHHTCGLKDDGSLICWGNNWYGQTIVPPGKYIQVMAGEDHTCGIKNDGTLVCWGAQTYAPTGTFPRYSVHENAQWSTDRDYRAAYEFTSAIPNDTYRVQINDARDSDGMQIAPTANATFIVDYGSSISDKTPPTKPTVTAIGDSNLTNLSARWSSSEPESAITQYRYAIGTTPGARDVVDWTYVSNATTSMIRSGLNLTYAQPYYVTVGARNEGGLWSEDGVSNRVVAGVTPHISGNAGIGGATLSYSDGTPKTVTANENGDYSFAVPYNWAGVVTPEKAGYTFTPISKRYTDVLANQTDQNYVSCPMTDVTIGGSLNGSYCLTSGQSTRQSYAANNGPVKVANTGATPILAAQRILYYGAGTAPTSFVEMMGLPEGQLDKTYWFPWYKNDGIVDTQLRIGNVSASTATVHIYIAGVEVTGSPFTLTTSGAGQSQRLSFALNDGPVKIVSDQNIVATERLIYFNGGTPISFSEMLGLPNSQLSNTYWFPWYKNAGEVDTQLRIGNVSASTATVHIYIAGVEVTGSPFILTASGAGQSQRLSFPVNNGPVKIVSDVNIVAAQRILYYAGGVPTSFVETMGIPDGQLGTTQWFPWYKNDGIVDTQLRIGNVSGAAASVHVYIDTGEMAGSPFALTATGAGQSLRLSFTANDGPVKIVSDQNIVTSERLIYFNSGVPVSFSEMMGLPNSQLSNTYWLPWYKNIGEIDTQLRFGVP